MRVLSLDTTTRAGSVALADGDRVIEEREGDSARTHAERLPGELIALLTAHGRTLADVDLFAVASGPGSFTGLRIGIATMQGAALVGGRPIVAVSALLALVHAGSIGAQPGDIVAVWMDAHRRDVFSALYRVEQAEPFALDRLIEMDAPQVGSPAAALARWRALGIDAVARFVGDGAVLYADVIAAKAQAGRAATRIIQPTPLLAGAIARLALARARTGTTTDPAGVQPLYVRRPDAEIARENAPPRGTLK
jgi:tRNA threonylcarbamoyladenosine biosynthesis protein TsaB